MMDCRWIEDIGEFGKIAGEWDKAVISSGDYNAFLLSDFIITWWKHFKDNLRLRIFVIYDNGRISAGIPLYLRRGGGGNGFARFLCHIGDTAANYTEPLYADDKSEMLSALRDALAKRNDWDVLYLTDIRSGNRLLKEYDEHVSDKRYFCETAQDHMNWAVDLSEGTEKYFLSVSKKLRRDLKAKRKHAERDYGSLRLEEIKGEEDIGRYFDLYTDFSLKAFSARSRKSNLESVRYAAFFKEFLISLGRNQRLDAHALFAGDKVLAVSFGYRFGKGFNWVLTGFNYEYKYIRPGYLLIEELIKEINGRGETYYNWYGHERFYKGQWCNSKTPLYRFFLFRRSLKGRAYYLSQKLVTMLRSNRLLVGLARRIKKA
jgi:CelD/BcsL family acetyltransferase involved in cellulose biosynthesis